MKYFGGVLGTSLVNRLFPLALGGGEGLGGGGLRPLLL